jgi:hypothetical protein
MERSQTPPTTLSRSNSTVRHYKPPHGKYRPPLNGSSRPCPPEEFPAWKEAVEASGDSRPPYFPACPIYDRVFRTPGDPPGCTFLQFVNQCEPLSCRKTGPRATCCDPTMRRTSSYECSAAPDAQLLVRGTESPGVHHSRLPTGAKHWLTPPSPRSPRYDQSQYSARVPPTSRRCWTRCRRGTPRGSSRCRSPASDPRPFRSLTMWWRSRGPCTTGSGGSTSICESLGRGGEGDQNHPMSLWVRDGTHRATGGSAPAAVALDCATGLIE